MTRASRMRGELELFAGLVEKSTIEFLFELRREREKDYIVDVFDSIGVTVASHNLGILLPSALDLDDFAEMTLSDFIESFGDEED